MPPSNSHYIITGASSGIGAALLSALVGQGHTVTSIARRPAAIESAQVRSIECDLSQLDRLEATLDPLKKLAAPEGVIFCHGYGDFGSLEQFSAKRIRKLVDTNLTSTIMLARLLLPRMKACGRGAMMFVGSESARRGGRQGAVYSATKFALRGLAQSLRQEASHRGVRVLLVNPGMADTPFFDQLHFAPGDASDNALTAGDVAAAIIHGLHAADHVVVDELNLSPLKHVVQPKRDR